VEGTLLQHPPTLIATILAAWGLVRLQFYVLRSIGIRGATEIRRKVAVWAVIILFAAAPVAALVTIAFIVLIVGILQLLAYAVVVATPWGRRHVLGRTIRSRLIALRESERSTEAIEAPSWLFRTWSKALETLDFVPVDTGWRFGDMKVLTLNRSADGVIAMVVDQPQRIDLMPFPMVQMVSVSRGRAGVLSTSIGPMPVTSPTLITQMVRTTRADRLLATHKEGQRLLEAAGLPFEAITATDTPEIRAWIWEEMRSALVGLPIDSLLDLRTSVARRPFTLAETLNHPAIAERIERLVNASARRDGSGPI
jgi:hypothetical protein